MDEGKYSTLVAALKAVPDPRDARGKRHAWWMLLTLIAGALASGQHNGRAIGQWVREHYTELVALLQPAHGQLASESTLRRALRAVDLAQLEALVAQVGEGKGSQPEQTAASDAPAPVSATALQGLAVDGKQLRGVAKHRDPLTLVSVVRHGSGQVLAQQAVAADSSESQTVPDLLAHCDLHQCVVTLDALHTARGLAEQIVQQGGHYLMVVKANQPRLLNEIALLWQMPPWQGRLEGVEPQPHRTVEKDHGRLERRILEASTALNDYLTWPAVQQLLRRTCRRICLKTGEVSETTPYAITSLPRALADAVQLEALWRGHWTIENRLHYMRDVTFGEDACQVHTANAPHALATLRNAVLARIRATGWLYVADALRHYAAAPERALRLIGAIA